MRARMWIVGLVLLVACRVPSDRFVGVDGAGERDAVADGTPPGCGNGNLEPGEVCDDGNTVDGEQNDTGGFVLDHCSHDCLSTQVCGNGVVDRGEQCDLGAGNGLPGATCYSNCRAVSDVCGNGVADIEKGEDCDPGVMDSATCNSNMAGAASCKVSRCGDGYVNMAAAESCDSGADTAQCNGRLCTLTVCGDNYVNQEAGEQCESSGRDSQTCNGRSAAALACHVPLCGDGYVNTAFTPPGGQATEECDNANGVDTAACNGNKNGNAGPGSCRASRCGDGYFNRAAGETCESNADCAAGRTCTACKCG